MKLSLSFKQLASVINKVGTPPNKALLMTGKTFNRLSGHFPPNSK